MLLRSLGIIIFIVGTSAFAPSPYRAPSRLVMIDDKNDRCKKLQQAAIYPRWAKGEIKAITAARFSSKEV